MIEKVKNEVNQSKADPEVYEARDRLHTALNRLERVISQQLTKQTEQNQQSAELEELQLAYEILGEENMQLKDELKSAQQLIRQAAETVDDLIAQIETALQAA